ncbi:MAG TPA: phosphate ABC transporter permease subunit PstC [Microbacteriaceae bacterium]|nr:phosphate ABC transporter permease subunit PstC [Microbacteriaceae bacterium]
MTAPHRVPRPGEGRPEPGRRRAGDTVFRWLTTGSAASIIAILAGVTVFLIVTALPALTADWRTAPALAGGTTGGVGSFWRYVAPLLWGTAWSSLLALILGTPVALGIALYVSHYAPRPLRRGLGYLIDLLAAVPSVVFGLWGIFVLRPAILPLQDWLNHNLSWIPLFAGPVSKTGSTMLAAAIILAVMIIPIISSIAREIFAQTPRLHEEAALALGATRWEMIRLAVLPQARRGIVSATLLGLGRALGETMAVALILSPSLLFSVKILTDTANPQTVAANLALNFPESTPLQRDALIATGLVLFIISFAVNALGRLVAGRAETGRRKRGAA